MSEIHHLGILDPRGVLIRVDQVTKDQHTDGPNQKALPGPTDLAMGRYVLEKLPNGKFRFVPVTSVAVAENAAADAAITPKIVRAILDMNGRGQADPATLKDLRDWLNTLDAQGV